MSGGSKKRKILPLKPHLPHDLLCSRILAILPAESLHKFRLACKLWWSTIADPKFVSSHFLRSKQNPSLLGIFTDKNNETVQHLVFNLDHMMNLQGHDQGELETTIVGPNRMFVGCCNGLICFQLYLPEASIIQIGLEICNPTTREILFIPAPKVPMHRSPDYGFGFNSLKNEYKVVCFYTRDKSMVYTLGTNSWRSVVAIPELMLNHFDYINQPPVITDGVHHELTINKFTGPRDGGRDKIILFDIQLERLQLIEAPTYKGFCWPSFNLQGCMDLASRRISFLVNFCANNNKHYWEKEKMYLPVEHVDRVVEFFNKVLLHWTDPQFLTLYEPHTGIKKQVKLLPNVSNYGYEIVNHVENLLSLETFKPPGESEVVYVSSTDSIPEQVLRSCTGFYGYR